MRTIVALCVAVLLLLPVQAQETHDWQATIDSQIAAMRQGDAESALAFAGDGFRSTYSDPQRFYDDVVRAGYEPIVRSRSHTFGEYRDVAPGVVQQIVLLVGPDQRLYEAVYELVDEPDLGWRVRGVVLRSRQGLGV